MGCLGASQSFSLRRQASWLKVWRGGGCNFNAMGRAHKRSRGRVSRNGHGDERATQMSLWCSIQMSKGKIKKTPEIKSESKQPEETIAGQALIIFEAFSRAIDKARGKAVDEPQFSACLPVWCHNIADIVAKTVFKKTVALDPKGQFDARNFGRILGLMLRIGVFAGKELEPILKKEGLFDLSKPEEKKIEDMAGLEHLLPIASKKFNRPIRNENQLLSQSGRYAKKWGMDLLKSNGPLFLHLWNQPVEEQHQFLCGIAEPVHVHAEIVQAAQINIRGNRAHLQNFQKHFALRFNDDLRQQRDKRLVLGGGFPAVLVRSLFGAGQRFNGVLPCPRGDAVVAARQIRLGDLEIQHRLAFGVVFGFDDLSGIVGVGGAAGWCVCRSWCPRNSRLRHGFHGR